MNSTSPALLLLVYSGGFVLFWGLIALLIVQRMRASRQPVAALPATNSAEATPIVARRWNTFAIVAVALSLYVLLIPMIFAIVALVQISRSGDRGRTLAIIAIVLQALGLLGLVAFLTIGGEHV